MKSKTKQRIAVLFALLAVTGILVGIKAGQIVTMVKASESFVPPPEAVTSARVESTEWQTTRAAIGSLVAVRGVTLGAEVPGIVREISFESGSSVKRGTSLVKLDSSAEEAELEAASADASLARLTLERTKKLREKQANAAADLDSAEARAAQTSATVANLKAVIAKKTVRAPFDGRISIRQVELGQILSPGTPIASLQTVDPIYADFWLPQQALAELRRGQPSRLRTDAFPAGEWDGQVTVINPEVDPTTRNVRVRATFPNRDGRLVPGMFANVEVLSEEKRPVLIIPATSVLFAPYGDTVFVIVDKPDAAGKMTSVVHQQFVRVGERRGDLVAVISGLEAGQSVVSTGGFKLRNGQRVAVNNTLAPKAELTPKPTED